MMLYVLPGCCSGAVFDGARGLAFLCIAKVRKYSIKSAKHREQQIYIQKKLDELIYYLVIVSYPKQAFIRF